MALFTVLFIMPGEISCYWFPPSPAEKKLLLATTLPHTHTHTWSTIEAVTPLSVPIKVPYLKYADEPHCGVRALDRRPFSRPLSIIAKAWGPGTPGVRAFHPLGLDFCHRRLTNHPHTHKGPLDPQRERAGPTAAGLSELTALFFFSLLFASQTVTIRQKGKDGMLKEEKGKERAEERGKGESRKRDVWVLSFGATVINGCPFAGLCTPTVRLEPWVTRGSLREKKRQTDRQTENDRHLAIYILLEALRL